MTTSANDPEAGLPASEADGRAEDFLGLISRLAGKLDLKSLERMYILQTLAAVNGSRKAAVARLGISERTLRNKLQQYRLESST